MLPAAAAAAHRKYHFHLRAFAICSASVSCHGGNVQSSLKDNYTTSETLFFPGGREEAFRQNLKITEQSVSVAVKMSCSE